MLLHRDKYKSVFTTSCSGSSFAGVDFSTDSRRRIKSWLKLAPSRRRRHGSAKSSQSSTGAPQLASDGRQRVSRRRSASGLRPGNGCLATKEANERREAGGLRGHDWLVLFEAPPITPSKRARTVAALVKNMTRWVQRGYKFLKDPRPPLTRSNNFSKAIPHPHTHTLTSLQSGPATNVAHKASKSINQSLERARSCIPGPHLTSQMKSWACI